VSIEAQLQDPLGCRAFEEGLPTREDHPGRGLALLTGPVVDLLACRSRCGGAWPCCPARQPRHLDDRSLTPEPKATSSNSGRPIPWLRRHACQAPKRSSEPALAFHHRASKNYIAVTSLANRLVGRSTPPSQGIHLLRRNHEFQIDPLSVRLQLHGGGVGGRSNDSGPWREVRS
jgi:hypothetical protein